MSGLVGACSPTWAVPVAVTRARRRLYVIGNHATWGNAPYFRVLARHPELWPPAEYRQALPAL